MEEKFKLPKNHQIIRNAYEGTLTASARLAAYASCTPTRGPWNLIDNRQTLLATDDLIHFALNARRLIDNTKSFAQIESATIKVATSNQVEDKSVSRILNVIIHHKLIDIFRFNYELQSLSNLREEELFAVFSKENVKSFPPMINIQSDAGGAIMFKLQDLIVAFENKILDTIVDACSDLGLFLHEF